MEVLEFNFHSSRIVCAYLGMFTGTENFYCFEMNPQNIHCIEI